MIGVNDVIIYNLKKKRIKNIVGKRFKQVREVFTSTVKLTL